MAYTLVNQDGKKLNINGFKRGYINVPYVYNGMELYNENAISTNRYPFYCIGSFRVFRRVRIGSSYYYPSKTNKKYVDEAYSATEIAINGKYSNSSEKDYEVYRDGNLIASGSFTNSLADICVCEKEANTSIIVSGIWDETNSKFIYNITTNATITREKSYQWDNRDPEWHTLWEGNQECIASAYWGNWTFTPSSPVTLCSIDTSTIPDLSNVQCRITFSEMSAGGKSTSYTPSPKPTSPYTFTDITTARTVLEAEGTSTNAAYWCSARVKIARNGNTTNFIADVFRSQGSAAAGNQSYYGEITITKIELYYKTNN